MARIILISLKRRHKTACDSGGRIVIALRAGLKLFRLLHRLMHKPAQRKGDPAYGDDSPLYGAMDFVCRSERKSGLTKKKKTP